jgi:hypothetical protein
VANHGTPEEFITDRDKLWISKFWQSLIAQLGVNHKLSTAYHPQTDRQTERLNQTLEAYLRCYVSYDQDDWVQYLPLAQFAYNSTVSEPIGVSPFFANHGYNPTAYKQPRADTVKAQDAIVRAERLKDLHSQLGLDLEFIEQKSTEYANKKRSQGPSLQNGDRVYLLRRHIKTRRPSDKLDFKKLGLFRVIERVSSVNYKLELPKTSKLHPVFHVSLLEPAKGTAQVDRATDIQPEHDADIYNIEKILDRRISKGIMMYLVKWLDWDDIHNSWEPESNLSCPEKLEAFYRLNPTKPRKDSREGSRRE